MSFSIRIKGSAARELKRIDRADRSRIASQIDRLAEHPYVGSALKGDLRGLRRLRVGQYRVIYEIQEDELMILVVRIAHRREVYR